VNGDLLLIVPTRGRPESIIRLMKAMRDTCKMETHLVIGVDDDDPGLSRYGELTGLTMVTGPRKGLAEWTNDLAMARVAEYPYLASLGDDHVPVTPGWDRALIRAIESAGGVGFAYPWDDTREDIPEACVMSSAIVAALGWMCLPDLQHWYVDNVWADLGKGIGVLRHLRAVKVSHAWKADQTSKDSSERLAADRDAYYQWRRSGRMADDIKALTVLRDEVGRLQQQI